MNEGKYHIGFCIVWREGVKNVIIKDSVITAEELVEPIKQWINDDDRKYMKGVSSQTHRRYTCSSYCDIEFFLFKMDNFPQYEELLKLRERYENLSERCKELELENKKLKERNVFLECEPYRGPEFFQMLDEEVKDASVIRRV